MRHLKGLTEKIDVSVVHWEMLENGWSFPPGADKLFGSKFVSEYYKRAEEGYDGRFTVPILWDKLDQTILNNESSEIIRLFDSGFNSVLPSPFKELDFYPEDLRAKVNLLTNTD